MRSGTSPVVSAETIFAGRSEPLEKVSSTLLPVAFSQAATESFIAWSSAW